MVRPNRSLTSSMAWFPFCSGVDDADEYQDGTLREKLMGPGRARLREPHPATQHRR